MSVFWLLLSLFLIILWLNFLWKRRLYYKVAFQLPGPIGWPFIGLALKLMSPDRYLQFFEETAGKYKTPLISWMGTNCFLYVNDPETVELIFNSPQCVNKGDFYRFVASAIGDGLFTSSVPRWNHHRRLINPAFNRNILNSFLPIFNAEADTLLEKLSNAESVEMFELLKRSVLETACQTTMGKRMNFPSNGSAAIFESYNGLTEACVKRMLSPWLYSDMIFKWSSLYEHQKAVVSVLYEFIEGLLRFGVKSSPTAVSDVQFTELTEQKNNNFRAKGCNSSTKDNSQHHHNDDDDDHHHHNNNDDGIAGISKSKAIFVEQVRNHVDQGQLTWNDVRDEANVIIAASFETTSTALYIVCLCLAIHPEYQDRLYDELVDLFPPGNDVDVDVNGEKHPQRQRHNHHHITKEHIDRMTYTEMVINEAMRLFSPVPMVLRRVTDNECKLRGNVTLPLGTQIGIDIYNMHRSELVWGPHAKDFRPELHFGENSEKRHPFAFIPFTKGLRMCLGSRYAMMLMKVFIAKIFRNFRLSTNSKLKDLKIKGTISLKLAEYPTFQITKREE